MEKQKAIQILNERLARVEKDVELRKQEEELYLLMKEYKGEDEVISSEEIPSFLQNAPPRIQLGVFDIDAITGGFGEENLIVISGPTGQGKSTLAQNMTSWLAKNNGRSLWFSFEMSLQELYERFKGFAARPIFYTPRSNVSRSMVWLERKIVEGIAKYDTKFVFIDHTHYLVNLRELGEVNSSLYLGDMIRELKLIARKYQIIIFLIHHLKKTEVLEAPTISDLRDSSFVGQEADYVLIVWRKPVTMKKKDMLVEGIRYTNETLVSVVKNRPSGRLGTATFIHDRGMLTPAYVGNPEENLIKNL